MLEVRNLSKVYKPKKGVPVRAIDNISLKFPEKGMVFLLGKSGSGKSTLLNLLGGLDRYDGGEIIIKDVSSASFKQSHFDSYRNTYLGFIFQEYNILEEFNVGANIALALELQGRKATDEEINRILKQVDLEGYGNRKPNELSGGQKQRVAIARALVKNPEIIMADEPTGALDSATVRQVLDTLKKLSAEKLVIVVSHDREFAEKYADRIIELADGRVISDMEYFGDEDAEPSQENVEETLHFDENEITVAPAYHLTEEDLVAINQWLDGRKGGKITAVFSKKNSSRKAQPTDESKIAQVFSKPFQLIKSKLPMKNAFKIGASSLTHKKFRLVVTILLSCISFGLFGLSDTFGCYNHVNTCTKSIMDTGVNYASFIKNVAEGDGDYQYWEEFRLTDDDIRDIEKDLGMKVSKILEPSSWENMFDSQYDVTKEFTKTNYHIYAPSFKGLATISDELLKDMGADLVAGALPDGKKDEMAITTYLAQTFIIGGYREPGATGTFETITKPEDMVGKYIQYGPKKFKVTGVIDTHFDIDRYKPLTEEKKNQSNADTLVDFALNAELDNAKRYSLISMALVGEGYIDSIAAEEVTVINMENGWCDFIYSAGADGDEGDTCMPVSGFLRFGTYKDKIVWLNGAKTELADNEIVVGEESLREMMLQTGYEGDIAEFAKNMPKIKEYITKWTSEDVTNNEKMVQIVGYLPNADKEERANSDYAVIVNDKHLLELCSRPELYEFAKYTMAVGAMPDTYSDIKQVVAYSYRDNVDVRYALANSVTFELDVFDEVFKVLGKVFFWIGVGFAIFASIMLANFISSSIAYKKQEIGILRAIGARGSDVFRIFFSESFIIAMINFTLSAIGTGVVTAIINGAIRKHANILVTILNFGIRQVALLFAVSIVVAVLASFFPVWHIAKKRPIDAIRNR